MLRFFNKKTPNNENAKKRIELEIEKLRELKEGIYNKYKEYQNEYYITIIIDTRILSIDSGIEKDKLPDYIVFLIIVDLAYPERKPFVLSRTNFNNPSLMDGRDLLKNIYPNYTSKNTIIEIVNEIPHFIEKVINAIGYKFYGEFHLGSTYDMKNFDNMIVNTFKCKIDKNDKENINRFNYNSEYILILSNDCLILFDVKDTGNGVIVFWSSLFAITDLQLNKVQKVVSINFYDDETNNEFHLKLIVENILFFRDTLVKKMRFLKVKPESQKLIKGQKHEKRITAKEILNMKIDEIEKNVINLKERIEKGEINGYTVNTFTTLCGKAIEHFSMIGDNKHMQYLNIMKDILKIEKVNQFTIDNQKELDDGIQQNK